MAYENISAHQKNYNIELCVEIHGFYCNATTKTFVLEQYTSLCSSFEYLKIQDDIFGCIHFK